MLLIYILIVFAAKSISGVLSLYFYFFEFLSIIILFLALLSWKGRASSLYKSGRDCVVKRLYISMILTLTAVIGFIQ